MAVGRVILKTIFYLWRYQDRGNASACGRRQAAARVIALTFVPCNDNQIWLAVSIQSRNNLSHETFEPTVRDRDGAIVRVVAHVWGDEHEVRKRTRRNVRGKLRERNDTVRAKVFVQSNRLEIDKGIMLHKIVPSLRIGKTR